MAQESTSSGVDTLSREKSKTRLPKMYRVLLLNDDYTTMDFVVSILEGIFRKSPSEATRIMLEVHHAGAGTCGLYTREIAETKVDLVHRRARDAGFPLRAVLEPES